MYPDQTSNPNNDLLNGNKNSRESKGLNSLLRNIRDRVNNPQDSMPQEGMVFDPTVDDPNPINHMGINAEALFPSEIPNSYQKSIFKQQLNPNIGLNGKPILHDAPESRSIDSTKDVLRHQAMEQFSRNYKSYDNFIEINLNSKSPKNTEIKNSPAKIGYPLPPAPKLPPTNQQNQIQNQNNFMQNPGVQPDAINYKSPSFQEFTQKLNQSLKISPKLTVPPPPPPHAISHLPYPCSPMSMQPKESIANPHNSQITQYSNRSSIPSQLNPPPQSFLSQSFETPRNFPSQQYSPNPIQSVPENYPREMQPAYSMPINPGYQYVQPYYPYPSNQQGYQMPIYSNPMPQMQMQYPPNQYAMSGPNYQPGYGSQFSTFNSMPRYNTAQGPEPPRSNSEFMVSQMAQQMDNMHRDDSIISPKVGQDSNPSISTLIRTHRKDTNVSASLQHILKTNTTKTAVLRILCDGETHSEHDLLRGIKKNRFLGTVAFGMMMYNLIEMFGKEDIIEENNQGTRFYTLSDGFRTICNSVFQKSN